MAAGDEEADPCANRAEAEKLAEAAKVAEAAVIRRIAEIGDFLRAEKGTLYSDASEALKEVRKDFYYWSTKLTESSFALSLAVIGANWAVFGSLDKILGNRWSQFSIATVILALSLNSIGYKRLIDALRAQIRYAEADRGRWKKEFEQSLTVPGDWPYTAKIASVAQFHRACRMWLPLLGGLLFLIALFVAPHPATPRDTSKPPTQASAQPNSSPQPLQPSPSLPTAPPSSVSSSRQEQSVPSKTTEAKVRRLIAEQLGVEPAQVIPTATIVGDLGADDLDVVELIMAVEEKFNIEIPNEDAQQLKTVGNMCAYVSAHAKPN